MEKDFWASQGCSANILAPTEGKTRLGKLLSDGQRNERNSLVDKPTLPEAVPEISGVLRSTSVAWVTVLVSYIRGDEAGDGAGLPLTHSGSFPARSIPHSQSQFSCQGSSPSKTVPHMPTA